MKSNLLSPSRQPRFGTWQSIPSATVSRYLARSGWDFVIVDLQHGPLTLESAYDCLHTLREGGVEPWLRVPVDGFADISRALDCGASAIVFPMANSPLDVRKAVEAAKYPPIGRRSVGGDIWHHVAANYISEANHSTQLIVQIEHEDGVKALAEIDNVPGFDGYFAGPADLALSLGLTLDNCDADVRHRDAIQKIVEAAGRARKFSCIASSTADDALRRARQGFDCIVIQTDVDRILGTSTRLLNELRAMHAESGASISPATKKF